MRVFRYVIEYFDTLLKLRKCFIPRLYQAVSLLSVNGRVGFSGLHNAKKQAALSWIFWLDLVRLKNEIKIICCWSFIYWNELKEILAISLTMPLAAETDKPLARVKYNCPA
jgi:hypothetical protein